MLTQKLHVQILLDKSEIICTLKYNSPSLGVHTYIHTLPPTPKTELYDSGLKIFNIQL